MRFAVLSIVGSACASVGDPPSVERLVTIEQGGRGAEVRVDADFEYEMGFSNGPVQLPDRLSLPTAQGGVNILGVDITQTCNTLESLAGIALFPATIGTANTSAEQPSSTIQILADHPALAILRVTYGIPYPCPDPTQPQILNGDSTFTLYASGRIVREDNVVPSQDQLSTSAGGRCGCAGNVTGLNFNFTSFWAFQPETFQPAGSNDPLAKVVNTAGDPAQNNSAGACTISPGYTVAVHWYADTIRTRFVTPSSAATHVFDLIVPSASLSPEPQSVVSAVQLLPALTMGNGTEQCMPMLEQLAARDDLEIATVPLGPAPNGVYRDARSHSSAFDIVALGSTPKGFAISVNLGGSQHARITKDGGFGSRPPIVDLDPILDEGEEEGDRFLIYFQDALFATERITIEPL